MHAAPSLSPSSLVFPANPGLIREPKFYFGAGNTIFVRNLGRERAFAIRPPEAMSVSVAGSAARVLSCPLPMTVRGYRLTGATSCSGASPASIPAAVRPAAGRASICQSSGWIARCEPRARGQPTWSSKQDEGAGQPVDQSSHGYMTSSRGFVIESISVSAEAIMLGSPLTAAEREA